MNVRYLEKKYDNSKVVKCKISKQSRINLRSFGFTLIEMLIVIIVLGILASIIIPQITNSTDDTKLKTLKTNLKTIRNVIELYYLQHDQTYPARNNPGGNPTSNETVAAVAFIKQLVNYTDITGSTNSVLDRSTHPFGPYLKALKLPINPFNQDNTMKCDVTTVDITAVSSDGTTGYKFYTQTGILIANDGTHDDL